MTTLTWALLFIILALVIAVIMAFRVATGSAATIEQFFSKKMKILDSNVQKQFAKQYDDLTVKWSQFYADVKESARNNESAMSSSLTEMAESFDQRFGKMMKANADASSHLVNTMESKLRDSREAQERRLTQIQDLVDEHLTETLNTRLNEQFGLLVKSLDDVSGGLSSLTDLSEDARELRKALTGVRDRGTYGNVHLGQLLSDVLTESQYVKDVDMNGGAKPLDFGVYVDAPDGRCIIPIDSRFPIDEYNRFASSRGKHDAEPNRKILLNMLKISAKEIHDSYISPPATTDFALLYLPTEGMYFEAIRDAGFFEDIRSKYSVTFVGPATLSAYLGALRSGYAGNMVPAQPPVVIYQALQDLKSNIQVFESFLQEAMDDEYDDFDDDVSDGSDISDFEG